MKVFAKNAMHLLLTVSIVFYGLAVSTNSPTAQAQQPQSEFEARITAELTTFAATHTQAELEAEIYRRLWEAEATESNNNQVGANYFGYYFFEERDRMQCAGVREEACREDYDRDLALATGVAYGVLAGCAAGTAGAGSIVCAVGALAVQQAGFAAARSSRRGCNLRAQQDCADEYK